MVNSVGFKLASLYPPFRTSAGSFNIPNQFSTILNILLRLSLYNNLPHFSKTKNVCNILNLLTMYIYM